MPQPIVVVDAFSDRPFAGNPAAVCLLAQPREAAWMQSVAAEMRHAETAFLVRRASAGDGAGDFDLRWFTPTVEVDLCGHATLASAHVLWEDGELDPGATARFHTRSGVLAATRREGLIELDFPAMPAAAEPPPSGLLAALGPGSGPGSGGTLRWSGWNRMDWLLELADEAQVRALAPDFAALARVPARGVIVTARAAGSEADFVSRFFAPASGVDEDPVTGSAHCALGPHWRERLGRDQLIGYQASARGGTVRVRLAGERVVLGGRGVTVLRGELVAG